MIYNFIIPPKLHEIRTKKTIIKLYYEAQYRMYRWNTPNKFVQTNLNMRYLDSRYNKPFFCIILSTYGTGEKGGSLHK
jgi:hypothetical protein